MHNSKSRNKSLLVLALAAANFGYLSTLQQIEDVQSEMPTADVLIKCALADSPSDEDMNKIAEAWINSACKELAAVIKENNRLDNRVDELREERYDLFDLIKTSMRESCYYDRTKKIDSELKHIRVALAKGRDQEEKLSAELKIRATLFAALKSSNDFLSAITDSIRKSICISHEAGLIRIIEITVSKLEERLDCASLKRDLAERELERAAAKSSLWTARVAAVESYFEEAKSDLQLEQSEFFGLNDSLGAKRGIVMAELKLANSTREGLTCALLIRKDELTKAKQRLSEVRADISAQVAEEPESTESSIVQEIEQLKSIIGQIHIDLETVKQKGQAALEALEDLENVPTTKDGDLKLAEQRIELIKDCLAMAAEAKLEADSAKKLAQVNLEQITSRVSPAKEALSVLSSSSNALKSMRGALQN
jgi:hypothetical protein